MTVVEPKALRTSRIATEAIHSSLPASRNYSFSTFCPSYASKHNRQRRLASGSKSWFRRHAESKPDVRL
jgi:hypothetical protein